MNLLIDLGNTALKWATTDDPESPHTIVHGGTHHFSEKLLSSLEKFLISMSMVALWLPGT